MTQEPPLIQCKGDTIYMRQSTKPIKEVRASQTSLVVTDISPATCWMQETIHMDSLVSSCSKSN